MFINRTVKKGYLKFTFFFALAFLLHFSSSAQSRKVIAVNAKFKIDGNSNYSDAYMVLERDGKAIQTLTGQSSYKLNLEIGADYIMSFSKPGYITKKINFNTYVDDTARVNEGFESYPFTVVLLKQYDGVNIVVFNQPVGKIHYSDKYDDFDYDTDYTKSIQSAVEKAEEELKQAEKEQKVKAAQVVSDSLANSAQKQKEAEAKKKEEQQLLKQQQEQAKKDSLAARTLALEEKKKQDAEAKKQEEENKNALKAKEEEDKKAKAAIAKGEDEKKLAKNGSGEDKPAATLAANSGQDTNNDIPGNAGNDGIKPKVKLSSGEDKKPVEKPKEAQPVIVKSTNSVFDEDITIKREDVTEDKKTISHVWVTKGDKTILFSKVTYNWGGVYYFRDMKISISENMFKLANAGQISF
jgi:hypothetical protein